MRTLSEKLYPSAAMDYIITNERIPPWKKISLSERSNL